MTPCVLGRLLWVAALSLAACSSKHEKQPSAGSDKPTPPKADAATKARDAGWRFLGFSDPAEPHPYALLENAEHLQLVGADGKTIVELSPTNIEHLITTSVPGTFIWVDADTIHAVEIPSGHERWSRTATGLHALAALDDALALADDGAAQGSAHGPEAVVLDVNTGRDRYRQSTSIASIGGSRSRHSFVFFGASSAVMVDAGSGQVRWTTNVTGADGTTTESFDGTIYVVRPDRTYAELDAASGHMTEGKCTEAASDPQQCLGTPSGAGERSSLGTAHLQRGQIAYAALGTWPKNRTLLARDPVGKPLWKADLRPCADARTKSATPEHVMASQDVAVLPVTCSDKPALEVLVVGQADGHIRYRHRLDRSGRLVAVNDRCVLVMDGAKDALDCLDTHADKNVWSVPLVGVSVTEATALPLENGDALLVDSNPLTLSRLGADGKRTWQTPLGDTTLSMRRDSDQGVGVLEDRGTGRRWVWSQAIGVLAPSAKDEPGKASILDLATGKLHDVD